nr:Orf1238 [Oedogonium sp. HN1801B]
MVKFTKEYLSLIQCLLYKAQKRKRIKQVLKFQKIFYKSNSIISFLLNYQSSNNLKRKKVRKCFSDSIFRNFLKFSILKKQIQHVQCMNNTQLKSKKKIRNYSDNLNNLCSYILLLNSKKKKLFFFNLTSNFNNIKLSFLYIRHFKIEFINLFTYSIFLLFLSTLNLKKRKNLLNKESKYLLGKYKKFNYQTYYNSYLDYHNFFLDSIKIKYQQNFYFHLLSNKKQKFLKKKRNIKIHKLFNQKNFNNYKNYIFKNNNFFYYSTISNFPLFRNNSCFFSYKFLNNLLFDYLNKIKFLKINLNNLQKKILLIILEPIWESSFEVSSYSHRPGRSLYDAIEYIRLNLKKQPMFLFKIYLKFLDKISYKNFNKLSYSILYKKNLLFNKFNCLDNNINSILSFVSFFQNIAFYGIQKKYQNNYLRTKEQLFLYQIIKIIKENKKKNDIYFYKFFYNKYFCILIMQNKLQKKFINKKTLNANTICSYFRKHKYKKTTRHYKKFIIDFDKKKKIFFNKYKDNGLLLKNYLIHNFLIFSLNNFFFEKIQNLKHKLFLIELDKHQFPFDLEKLIFTFYPVTNYFTKIKGISFSTFLKDSNLFVSKSAFLFFFIKKNKNALFETNLLNYWSNDNFCFFKKINNSKKLTFKIHSIKKWESIFIFSTKINLARCHFERLLKINSSFLFGCFNILKCIFNISSFHNSFLLFLFFVKKIDFYSTLLTKNLLMNNNQFFLVMYYCNFYGQFFSFFQVKFKINFMLFLLKKNNIKLIWNSFIKYDNQIVLFNSNFVFLNSFQTILKKWMIFNKIFYSLFFKKHKIFHIPSFSIIRLKLKSFFHHYPDSICFYLKDLLNRTILNSFYLINLSNKTFYLKGNIKKEKNNKKFHIVFAFWSMKFFVIKEKHTYLLYKKKINGFSFFNFFMFHKNTIHQQFFLNVLFFWQFYFIQIIKTLKYINSFSNYYKIYFFIIKKKRIWIKKRLKQKIKFYFFQLLFFKFDYLISINYENFFKNLIMFSLKKEKILNSINLFNIIFSKILKLKDKSILIYYKKLLQQQQLKIYYYFSIKPSKSNIKKHLFQIYNLVKKNHNKTSKYIIFKLSKLIKNWCLYYQIITPTLLYKYLDYLTLQILWRWACKRHYQKSKKWIKMRYFHKLSIINDKLNKTSNQTIVFASKINFYINSNKKHNKFILFKHFFNQNINNNLSNNDKIIKTIFICLPNHKNIILIKHNFIQNDRSPFDGDFFYWVPRNFYH